MRWKLATKDWARSDKGYGICQTDRGRYAVWKDGTKFLCFADTKDQAKGVCDKDYGSRK